MNDDFFSLPVGSVDCVAYALNGWTAKKEHTCSLTRCNMEEWATACFSPFSLRRENHPANKWIL